MYLCQLRNIINIPMALAFIFSDERFTHIKAIESCLILHVKPPSDDNNFGSNYLQVFCCA